MPIYQYACSDESCDGEAEALVLRGEGEPETCPKCGKALKRVVGKSSFQLKGGGWYKDGYTSTKDPK